MTISHFVHKAISFYPYELDNTMLFSIFVLGIFTLVVGAIGIPFNQERVNLDTLYIEMSNNSLDWNEFLKDAIISVSISNNSLDWNEFLKDAIISVSIVYL
uniref:NAD(P)H-quinone oxidoreductase subunit 5, chloroplastic n=1 Tax=Solanum lycopersicum TaxID=4081 RepID=A0A3Q7GH17_SOLLC